MPNLELKTHRLLLKIKKTISVAESCTGGLLSHMLTRFSGSSKYFQLGVVVYSNLAKEKLLQIPHSLIKKNGAVSKPVAIAMARRVRKMAKTDLGIGITGIAGPTGGTYQKPKGTVFITIDSADKTISGEFHFQGTRIEIQKKAARKSLELLSRLL